MFAGAENLEAERASWDERWRLLLGARLPAGTCVPHKSRAGIYFHRVVGWKYASVIKWTHTQQIGKRCYNINIHIMPVWLQQHQQHSNQHQVSIKWQYLYQPVSPNSRLTSRREDLTRVVSDWPRSDEKVFHSAHPTGPGWAEWPSLLVELDYVSMCVCASALRRWSISLLEGFIEIPITIHILVNLATLLILFRSYNQF